jgi:hypothetical protein
MAKLVELVRGLGFYGATSIVAGTMIGTVVFVVPGFMLADVRRPWLVLLAWVGGGYAELGSLDISADSLRPLKEGPHVATRQNPP